jgi:type I restriction enzyme M protein
MNMQELIQETLWKKAAGISKDDNNTGSRLWGPGLVFLKYMSHAFDRLFQHLEGDKENQSQCSEDTNRYLVDNLLYIPQRSRWEYVLTQINRMGIGNVLDEAMEHIERFNPTVQQILPREYTSPHIRMDQLILFMEMLGDLPKEYFRTGEILQSVYSYFARNYLAAENKRQESLCTPEWVDKLLVAMVGPRKGKIFDPCCGVGSMLVESHGFISQQHNSKGPTDRVLFYGQESRLTNFKLCRMNLAIHGMDGTQVGWNNETGPDKDLHPGLKADYILCAPPYDSRYSAWMQYIISHLAPEGVAGMVLSKDALSAVKTSTMFTGEPYKGDARGNPAGNTLLDCIVALPDKLFHAAGMSACLWMVRKGKSRIAPAGDREQDNSILLIDATSDIPGVPLNKQQSLSSTHINEIVAAYRRWQDQTGDYKDVKGFCKKVDWNTVKRNHFDLTPKRYV